MNGERCTLAPVDGPTCARAAVVRVVDQTGGSAVGCVEHGARALRGISDARVYPLAGHDGAAIEVYRRVYPVGR